MPKLFRIPKTKKDSVIYRVQQIAKEDSGSVFLLDHVCMRMQERGITRQQILQVLKRGQQKGNVTWDSESNEPGFRCTLNAISAGECITVAAKLVERNDDEFVLVITTYEVV